MTPKPRKPRKVKPYTRRWEAQANAIARSWVNIKPCRDCGRPNVSGYCCNFCGSVNP
jgi:hypothetical protein